MLHSKSGVITSLSEVIVIEDLNCFEKKTFCNWSTLDISIWGWGVIDFKKRKRKGTEFEIIFTYFLFLMTLSIYRPWSPGGPTEVVMAPEVQMPRSWWLLSDPLSCVPLSVEKLLENPAGGKYPSLSTFCPHCLSLFVWFNHRVTPLLFHPSVQPINNSIITERIVCTLLVLSIRWLGACKPSLWLLCGA